MSRYFLKFILFLFICTIPLKNSFAQLGDLIHHFNDPTLYQSAKYGSSIAAQGQNIIIGAYSTDGGSVYIYDYTSNLLLTQINNPGSGSDQFGRSVAINDNTFLVGAASDSSSIGIAYRYNIDGTLLNTYQNPNPVEYNGFGHIVDYCGNNIVIAASSVVYLLDAETGSLIQEIIDPTLTQTASFGGDVYCSDENIVISAPYDDTVGTDSGAVYIFDALTGLLSQTIYNPNPDIQTFGASIAVNQNKILVGASDTGFGISVTSPGQAYVFNELTGDLLLTLQDPDNSIWNIFGESVDWLGNDILIGASGTDIQGNNSGAAYLFSGETGDLIHAFFGTGDVPFNDLFGHTVLGFNGEVFIGAVDEDYFLGCYTETDEWGNEYEQCDYKTSGGVDRFDAPTAALDTDGDGIINTLDIDDDNDGYNDVLDNCTLVSNNQLDTNSDGFGNACDADFNGDNIVNSLDLGLFKNAFFSTGVIDTDLNSDNLVNSLDLGLFKQLFAKQPGPSGLNP
ncbi:MAG: thrombospondin type 3 repeat-containing protein [Gammaproteobacteria bacterium]|nr:thrombospondin type 3 repeat-containing protein [Gammaproteobacteria bacterium]